jgi:hypothetical protein
MLPPLYSTDWLVAPIEIRHAPAWAPADAEADTVQDLDTADTVVDGESLELRLSFSGAR